MARPPAAIPEDLVARRIGMLLEVGVLAAAALILLGGVIYLSNHGGDPAEDRGTFRPMPAEFSRPVAILRGAVLGQTGAGSPQGHPLPAGQGRGRALIQVGLLLLIATPVMRVVVSVYAFARERDVLYVLFTLLVLAVLLYGLFSGQIH
jgi:uncharacterized membrane protein